MITKLDHIGIACRSNTRAEVLYHDILGLPVVSREIIETMKLSVVKVRAADIDLELLEPLEGEKVISKFLEREGEGIHHICFEVNNVEEAADHLKEKGYTPVWERPRTGAQGAQVNFLRPKETGGVLIELSQPANIA